MTQLAFAPVARSRTVRRRPSRASSARFALRPVCVALACLGAATAQAQSVLPTGPAVQRGVFAAGSFVSAANKMGGLTMQINQASQRSVVQWDTFSIGALDGVNITQQTGPAGVMLSRVMGNQQSEIMGSLTSNGKVFLINPAGIVFGKESTVSVGGLVASALNMQNSYDNFMAGPATITFMGEASGNGNVVSQGNINVAMGGTAALIGNSVSNFGTIVADGGTAGLAAGAKVIVDFAGDGLTTFRVSPGENGGVANLGGTMRADGGRVALVATNATGSESTGGVVNFRGLLRANSLGSRNGEIILDAGDASEGVTLTGGTISAVGAGAGQTGGKVDIKGRTVLVSDLTFGSDTPAAPGSDDRGLIDVSGTAGGGTIRLHAVAIGEGANATSGAIAVAGNSTLRADATGAGDGGEVLVLAERTLRAYGTFSARGGPGGGNGGVIETSGGFAAPSDGTPGGYSLDGIRVDASAPAGAAGKWTIDPFNVQIVDGVGPGVLPPFDPFQAIANSSIQDGDINATLAGGTSVRITTGAATSGSPFQGDITFGPGVVIDNASGKAVTFQLDAHRSIRTLQDDTVITSSKGSLDVVFNANADGASTAFGGGQISFGGLIATNGGNVAMTGRWANESNTACSVCLGDTTIDTRVGGTDAGVGGNVTLTGRSTGTNPSGFSVSAGVDINNTLISTSTGNVSILGTSTLASGVSINDTTSGPGGIYTTSGNISVTGVGSDAGGNSANVPGHGVVVGAGFPFTITGTPTLQTTTGDIDITGLRLAGGTAPVSGAGVLVGNRSLVTTLAGGDIVVTGESQGNGAGVSMPAETVITVTVPAGQIVGSHNVTLRAANNGTTDALAINAGAVVQAGQVLDLRPGGVDVAGPPGAYVPTAVDRIANPITLGGAANTGFAVSAAEFTRISGATVVAGSNTHAGNIDVIGPLAMASPLTLQNGGGGNITLGAPITTPQLGLVSAGNITQLAGANIAAGSLLALSSGGNVLLGNAGNNVGTVGGGAAGRFEYVDADALTLGAVTVIGFDAASNLPQLVSAGGMQADTVFVRNLAGDLSLGGNVTSGSGADLVTAARLQNPGGYTLGGASWRVWADTWVGETRGGLAGSGTLPNLFHCAFVGLCTVTVPASGNHFIYAQQPTATVFVGNVTRPYGFPNPFLFQFGVGGLILGDTAASFSGTQSTTANFLSFPGTYPINGIYTSAAGYAVEVVPGTLLITAALNLPKVDVLRELPSTYVYDRNIGQAPICLATGPLDGDRAPQGADVLAREWSKVRSRPNLLSCVDTERRNGCADF